MHKLVQSGWVYGGILLCLSLCRSFWATSFFNAAEQKEAVQTPRAQLEAFDQYFRLLLPEIPSPRR